MLGLTDFIEAGGLLLIALVIFAESGMMIGFLFPGDTLLVGAGVLAASGKLSLSFTVIVLTLAAIIGDNVGYHIGRHFGRKLFSKPDGIIFRHEYIMRAEHFYEKYGSRTMLLAHFIPIVRSFAPVAAGAAKMPQNKFVFYNTIGDIAWVASLTILGYSVGSRIPGITRLIEPVFLGIVVISLVPTIYHALKDNKLRSAMAKIFNFQKRTPPSS